ncbi:nucleic acid-binding protein [Fistulina hepatica ATCC 64428]|uniref:Nucleic acid-binding protein n=1 Tax=Fistulina hepatica ATCC 64428 TaxID=1128425 RepID=A0A0D7AJT0_9AGAR|nr:nucleic acid-binding protein [Fistulina hepatica ATCC 64428]
MPPMALRGIVTKVGVMNKTATVTVTRYALHKLTGKRLEFRKKYLTHDENNVLLKDDHVIIRNCPPISARKRFKLENILRSPETERRRARALLEQEIHQAESTMSAS